LLCVSFELYTHFLFWTLGNHTDRGLSKSRTEDLTLSLRHFAVHFGQTVVFGVYCEVVLCLVFIVSLFPCFVNRLSGAVTAVSGEWGESPSPLWRAREIGGPR
jgi:hypothetical protein